MLEKGNLPPCSSVGVCLGILPQLKEGYLGPWVAPVWRDMRGSIYLRNHVSNALHLPPRKQQYVPKQK